MDNNKRLAQFLRKVSNVFEILNIIENREEIIKNLTGTTLMNFSRILTTDTQIAPYLQDYSQVADADPNKLFDFLVSKGIDYQKFFSQAEKETLESFIKQMRSTLPPEKVEELNKVISE